MRNNLQMLRFAAVQTSESTVHPKMISFRTFS